MKVILNRSAFTTGFWIGLTAGCSGVDAEAMKLKIGMILLAEILSGCHAAPHPDGQWRLEGFDNRGGYTFVKDGVRYRAICTDVIDGSVRPDSDNAGCLSLRDYIGKAVPHVQQGDYAGDNQNMLFLRDAKGRDIDLTIVYKRSDEAGVSGRPGY